MSQRRVVCAANLNNDTEEIILGVRHWDSFMVDHNGVYPFWKYTQGFVDQFGIFMTREEAWVVAVEANQIIRRVGGDDGVLYSENLY